MNHFHFMHHMDFSERTGTVVGGITGALTGLVKSSLLLTVFVNFQEQAFTVRLFESCVITMFTALIGLLIGFYGTRLLKKLHQ